MLDVPHNTQSTLQCRYCWDMPSQDPLTSTHIHSHTHTHPLTHTLTNKHTHYEQYKPVWESMRHMYNNRDQGMQPGS